MKSIISTPLVLCLFICASCAMESVVNEGYRPFAGDDEGKILNEDAIDYMRSDDIVNDTVFTVNGVSFKMIRVEGGTFMMGNSNSDYYGAQPVHEVTLSSFYIAEMEVTQELHQAICDYCPSNFQGDNKPAANVSRSSAEDLISRLREHTGYAFNLPTEAQWEYAARGGKKSKGYVFSGSSNISDVAWYDDTLPHKVGTKAPNELGIHDMSGNVCEICLDGFSDYPSTSQTNPKVLNDENNIIRGGGFNNPKLSCNVFIRSITRVGYQREDVGIRLVII